MKNLKEKMYQAMDSFLVESEDMEGKFIARSLKQLNQDRHLFIKRMDEIILEVRKETAECVCDKMIIEMEEEHDLKTGMKLAGIKKQILKELK